MPWGRLPTWNREPKGEYIPEPGSQSIGDGGAFNDGVYVVKRRQDGRKCVEKRIKQGGVINGAAAYEISVLRSLNHKHVTEYIDSFIDTSGTMPRASIYMEYCDLGSLADALKDCRRFGQHAKEWAVWELFIQLTNAVAYCHHGIHDAVFEPHGSREASWIGVLHCDIKPGNVFLRSDYRSNFPQVVLGDFGQAIVRQDDGDRECQRQRRCYDRDWAPPEAPCYDCYSDIWSIGLVVQAMCRLEADRPEFGPKRTFWGTGKYYSRQLNDAIQDLMQTNPQDRPSVATFAPKLDMIRYHIPHGAGLNS
ncbi:hypothetical protein MMC07_001909 [Pseudocyphellaria aurata]|nr:hypothetical protein [Pseudocyphellaria aurata]